MAWSDVAIFSIYLETTANGLKFERQVNVFDSKSVTEQVLVSAKDSLNPPS